VHYFFSIYFKHHNHSQFPNDARFRNNLWFEHKRSVGNRIRTSVVGVQHTWIWCYLPSHIFDIWIKLTNITVVNINWKLNALCSYLCLLARNANQVLFMHTTQNQNDQRYGNLIINLFCTIKSK